LLIVVALALVIAACSRGFSPYIDRHYAHLALREQAAAAFALPAGGAVRFGRSTVNDGPASKWALPVLVVDEDGQKDAEVKPRLTERRSPPRFSEA
jgi:hypothetical protein